jgi:cytoskeletal protein CcmA (bactofilin family)
MMPAAEPALQEESMTIAPLEVARLQNATHLPVSGPRRLTNASSSPTQIRAVPISVRKEAGFQARTPVITGEATYRGTFSVDGIISGQMGSAGCMMTAKQRPKNGNGSEPELNGEITFKDMLRINGHVAGKVTSSRGTLIVDASAKVEAEIDVAVCIISGTVVGHVVGHERVEVGPGAEVNGNISTPALSIKPGAVFHGDCRMIRNGNK